jgi:hypothetical protein
VGTDGFTATAKGFSLIIKPHNFNGYNKLVDYCNESDLEYHTWSPRHIRPFKGFICNLHYTIPVEDIERALRDLGSSIISLLNVRLRISKQALSLVTVDLEAMDFNRSIFQLSFLLYSITVVENLHQYRYPLNASNVSDTVRLAPTVANHHVVSNGGNNHFTKNYVKSSELPAKCVCYVLVHITRILKVVLH